MTQPVDRHQLAWSTPRVSPLPARLPSWLPSLRLSYIIGHTTATATGTMPRDPTMAGMAMVVLALALASAAVDTAAGRRKSPHHCGLFFFR